MGGGRKTRGTVRYSNAPLNGADVFTTVYHLRYHSPWTDLRRSGIYAPTSTIGVRSCTFSDSSWTISFPRCPFRDRRAIEP